MKGENVFQTIHAVFCCIAVNAFIDDVIGVSTPVEAALQIVWISLAGSDAVAGSKGIAKADNDGAIAVRRFCLCFALRMERSGEAERKE